MTAFPCTYMPQNSTVHFDLTSSSIGSPQLLQDKTYNCTLFAVKQTHSTSTEGETSRRSMEHNLYPPGFGFREANGQLMVSRITVSSAAGALRIHTPRDRGVSHPWELKQLKEDIASAVRWIRLREKQRELQTVLICCCQK